MAYMEPILVCLFAAGSIKRKPTMSLAAYDIELLKAWYMRNVTEQGEARASRVPHLADTN